jgi:hypothetical protein
VIAKEVGSVLTSDHFTMFGPEETQTVEGGTDHRDSERWGSKRVKILKTTMGSVSFVSESGNNESRLGQKNSGD